MFQGIVLAHKAWDKCLLYHLSSAVWLRDSFLKGRNHVLSQLCIISACLNLSCLSVFVELTKHSTLFNPDKLKSNTTPVMVGDMPPDFESLSQNCVWASVEYHQSSHEKHHCLFMNLLAPSFCPLCWDLKYPMLSSVAFYHSDLPAPSIPASSLRHILLSCLPS